MGWYEWNKLIRWETVKVVGNTWDIIEFYMQDIWYDIMFDDLEKAYRDFITKNI